MEFQEVIEKRRSIRGYDSTRKVTKEQMIELVRSATLAPSWKNSQVARYHIAMSEKAMETVKTWLPEFNARNCEGASALIVTTIVERRSGWERDGSPSTEFEHEEWGIYDLGLASENLVLKAADMGLGTLIMGIRDAEKIREALRIPREEVIVSVISVGYPKTEAQMPKRKSVEEVARFY